MKVEVIDLENGFKEYFGSIIMNPVFVGYLYSLNSQ